MEKIKTAVISSLDSTLFSYSQVFFSTNRAFSVILLAVTFLDVYAGITGLLAVVISNGVAYLMGYNKKKIVAGLYGFNSVLVGLGLGIFYKFTFEFVILVFFASLFTLFLTILLEGVIGKYRLPYLSVPFLISIWMVTLAAREFSSLHISERGIYTLNEMYSLGGIIMVKLYDWFTHLEVPSSFVIYFRSLGAIYFQYHLFAGILIAIGILIYSRISFLLSLFGFFSAYLFYHIIGADIQSLSYSYIGFNFILTAIAIGGFFIVPSWYSFLWVLLLTPLLAFTTTSTSTLFAQLHLSIYSLPFNFIVLLFLYVLKFRERHYNLPELVGVQQYTPEKNLFVQSNYTLRFNPKYPVGISLPFWGKWTVTQGHDGEHTHKGEWKHAYDFEITDDKGNNYSGTGTRKEDYYCYNKPVIAPADGWISDIRNGVEDNEIGEVNLEQNWGNSILIKHDEHLFSQISHIRKDSIKVEKGDYVKKGQILASCGNSGRSPVPHIHFQIQKHPYIGSATTDYPFAAFVLHNTVSTLKSYERPVQSNIVSNIESNNDMEAAFRFVPGQTLTYSFTTENETKSVRWKVMADVFNNTYLLCEESRSKAYFKNEKGLFRFIHFEGKKNSLLYYFFLAAYKIVKGNYQNMTVRDNIPVYLIKNNLITLLHDFIAPFYQFLKVNYEIRIKHMEETPDNTSVIIASTVRFMTGRKTKKRIDFELSIQSKRIDTFTVYHATDKKVARWEK